MFQLALIIYGEDSNNRNTNCLIRTNVLESHLGIRSVIISILKYFTTKRPIYIDSVSISGIERFVVFGEQSHYIRQTLNLKLLGFLFNNFPVECSYQGSGIQQQRSVGQRQISLFDGPQIFSSELNAKICKLILNQSYIIHCGSFVKTLACPIARADK